MNNAQLLTGGKNTVFDGKKDGIPMFKIFWDKFITKKHTHARENARRRRQMERDNLLFLTNGHDEPVKLRSI